MSDRPPHMREWGFGTRLYNERMKHEWSQDRLADEAGMTQAAISYIEAGRADPVLSTLFTLQQALGVSWDTLLGKPKDTE